MSRLPGEVVLFRITPLLLNGIGVGHHVKAIRTLDRAIVKAASPRSWSSEARALTNTRRAPESTT
jgi:hypothetical protein